MNTLQRACFIGLLLAASPAVAALDPSALVVVDGTRAGHLAGVAGLVGTVDDLARALATSGFDAAVAAALPGGSGRRRFGWRGGDPAGPGGPVGAPVAPTKKTKKTAPAKQTRKRG